MIDHVSERIKTLRKRRNLTLRALASQAHVPQSTLSAVETGARAGSNLTLATSARLARALGVTVDYLAGMYREEDEKEDEQKGEDEAMGNGAREEQETVRSHTNT
jgi:transcriptional regulator with XRE-family HTH domain